MLNELLMALRSLSTNGYLLNEQRRTKKKSNYRELLDGIDEFIQEMKTRETS
jgi:hypothetical protein